MTARWALEGPVTRDLLTWGGRVIVHDSLAELEWLLDGVRIVRCPAAIPPEQVIGLRWLPQYEGVSWPLRRSEWRT